MPVHDLFIVGAGPSGLATAIAAKQAGLEYALVEKGVLVDAIFRFPTYMVFFTTPELLEIGGLPLVTPYEKPTRLEALRYYRRVTETYGLEIAFHERVMAIDREDGAFAVASEDVASRTGTRIRHARAVVLATGYYDHPNRLGIPGENLPHVSHYYREAHPHYRQHVVVVGGKNSAAEAALELYRAGARVTLVHRRPALSDSIKYWVKPDIENRIKAGAIEARFETCVVEIRPGAVVVEQHGTRDEIPANAVFLLTGYRPDVELMRRAGIRVDEETLAPEVNSETFETNVPNLFVAGGAIAGRNTGHIFIENGRFHGERIVQVLAERFRRS